MSQISKKHFTFRIFDRSNQATKKNQIDILLESHEVSYVYVLQVMQHNGNGNKNSILI